MSAIMTGLVWELPQSEAFGRPEKMILLAYADHADGNGRNIYPSIELICKKSFYEERSVQVITRKLESLGYLVDDGVGPHGTNRWFIPLVRTADGGAKIAPLQKHETAPEGTAPEETAPEPSVVVINTDDDECATQNVFTLYESNIGPLTPLIADGLKDIEQEYGIVWVCDAIKTAALAGGRSLKYIQAVLKNRKTNGNFKPSSAARGGRPVSQQDAATVIDQVLGV